MYRLPTIVNHFAPLDLPQCMYGLPNIQKIPSGDLPASFKYNGHQNGHENFLLQAFDRTLSHCNDSKMNPRSSEPEECCTDAKELARIGEKQDVILKQIYDLKRQVEYLKMLASSPGITTSTKELSTPAGKLNIVFQDQLDSVDQHLVIVASPAFPPYSLLWLFKQLSISGHTSSRLHLEIFFYTHSSVIKLPESLSNDEVMRSANNKPTLNSVKNTVTGEKLTVNVSFIWNDNVGQKAQLSCSSKYDIVGENNIAKYLMQLLKLEEKDSGMHHVDITQSSVIDYYFDLAGELLSASRLRQHEILNKIDSSLAASSYLSTGGFGVVDAVLTSVIAQRSFLWRLPPKANNWLERCKIILAIECVDANYLAAAGRSTAEKCCHYFSGGRSPVNSEKSTKALLNETGLQELFAKHGITPCHDQRSASQIETRSLLLHQQGLSKSFFLTVRSNARINVQILSKQVIQGSVDTLAVIEDESVIFEKFGMRSDQLTPFVLANICSCEISFLCDRALLVEGAILECLNLGNNAGKLAFSCADFKSFMESIDHRIIEVDVM